MDNSQNGRLTSYLHVSDTDFYLNLFNGLDADSRSQADGQAEKHHIHKRGPFFSFKERLLVFRKAVPTSQKTLWLH
jgi:hypothetical protein